MLGNIAFSRFGILMLAACMFIGFAPASRADINYDLTTDTCSGGCGPQASFGTVNLSSVNFDTVQVAITLDNGNEFVTTGSHTGIAFDISGAHTISLGTLPAGWVSAGTNMTISEPGLGDFTDGIDCSMGNTNSKSGCAGSNPFSGTLLFDVTRSTGLLPTDFILNGSGFSFGVDIISGTTGKTGLVAATHPEADVTPEPSYFALLAGAIAGLAVLKVRRGKTKTASA